jgi:hypothetical protein
VLSAQAPTPPHPASLQNTLLAWLEHSVCLPGNVHRVGLRTMMCSNASVVWPQEPCKPWQRVQASRSPLSQPSLPPRSPLPPSDSCYHPHGQRPEALCRLSCPLTTSRRAMPQRPGRTILSMNRRTCTHAHTAALLYCVYVRPTPIVCMPFPVFCLPSQ